MIPQPPIQDTTNEIEFESVAGGLDHSVEADIAEIRNLLAGYAGDASLLKELIQNAEDAESNELILRLLPGDPKAPHPLLQNPALVVMNDGDFTQANFSAMKRASLGSKAADTKSIGRFGKGLKSVFSISEAFFIFTKTDRALGWKSNEGFYLMNPWKHQRQAWTDQAETERNDISQYLLKQFATLDDPEKPRLGLWLPLRQRNQSQDAHYIRNLFPDEENDFAQSLANSLEGLSHQLVLLRNLKKVSLCKGDTCFARIAFGDAGQRMPDLKSGGGNVRGAMVYSESQAQTTLAYTIHSIHARESLEDLTSSPDWPKVISYDANGEPHYDQKDKGLPHVALALVRNDAPKAKPVLKTDWGVFLPVRDQIDGEPILLPRITNSSYSLFLHSYAFLDAQRTRIDGLDTTFLGEAPDPQTKIKRKWNERLIRSILLPEIPKLLQNSLNEQGGMMTADELEAVVRAFRETNTWRTFRRDICAKVHLLQEITPEGVQWVATEKPIVRLPKFERPARLFESFPGLHQLREQVTLTTQHQHDFNALINAEPAEADESQVKAILETVNGSLDASLRRWLRHLLPSGQTPEMLGRDPEWATAARALPLFRVTDDLIENQSPKEEYWSIDRLLEEDAVFLRDQSHRPRLQAAQCALPKWDPKFCESLPHWTKANLKTLSLEDLASNILSESLSPDANDRKKLLQLLKPSNALSAIQSVRYLVHGESAHIEAKDLLLIQGQDDDPLIFEAFKSTLAAEHKWCLVAEVWNDDFVLRNEQEKFRIRRIDAYSLAQHLQERLQEREPIQFPEQWSAAQFERLLQLILESKAFDAESIKQLVRRLPIHPPIDEGSPIALEDLEGDDFGFVLDSPTFREAERRSISTPLWEEALEQCKIIRLAEQAGPRGHQSTLFECDEGKREMGWEILAEACLSAQSPERFAPIIATALGRGILKSRVNQQLKIINWLPLIDGHVICPNQMVDLGGANDAIVTLFSSVSENEPQSVAIYVPDQILPELLEISGFRGIFCNNACHKGKAALRHLFEASANRQDLCLGLQQEHLPEDRLGFVSTLKELDALPAATLLHSLLQEQDTPELQQIVLSEETEAGHPLFSAFSDSEQMLALLDRLSNDCTESAFCAYLKAFVSDGHTAKQLEGIKLKPKTGSWKAAENLVWPSNSIVGEVQICDRQANLLEVLKDQTESDLQKGDSANEDANFMDNEALKEYLKPVSRELGSDLSAAFVAILGSKNNRDTLVQDLLTTNVKYENVDEFRQFLLDSTHDGHDLIALMSQQPYRFRRVEGKSIVSQSITGTELRVSMAKTPDSLLVGDTAQIFFKNKPIQLTPRLETLDRDQLLSAIISAADTIILRRLLNGVFFDRPPSIRQACEALAEMRPDLRQAQIEIKLSLAERMRMLRISDDSRVFKKAARFDECLQLATAAELDREANRKSLADTKEAKARNIRKETANAVIQLLRSDKNEASAAVASVRKKMRMLKYGPQSVLPELFQNADDAYVENSQLGRESDTAPVVVELTKEYLRFAHTGRPINNAGNLTGGDRKQIDFRRDIVKMLTLNFSDKEKSETSPTEALTGKLGLGFKSVYFLTDHPEIWSAPLRFSVIGGIYPDNVRSDTLQLESVAEELLTNGKNEGTVFHLPLVENYENADALVSEFYNLAAWFLIFSKRVTKIQFLGKIEGEFSKQSVQFLGENTHIALYPKVKEQLLVLDCSDSTNRAQAVLVLKDRKLTAPEDTIARLWVTTPLTDAMEATWVMNAAFEPDAGRSHISWRDEQNREKATAFSAKLYTRLLELFDQVDQQPELFGQPYDFWLSTWKLFRNKTACSDWSHLLKSETIHTWICWANEVGAFRRLCEERAVIPSGLPHELGSLLKLDHIRHRLHGDFANYPKVIETLSTWNSFEQTCPEGRTVSSEIANDLAVNFPDLRLQEIQLYDCLLAELPELGPVTGQMIERFHVLFNRIEKVSDQAWKKRQLDAFKNAFAQCRFAARDDGAYRIEELLFPTGQSNEISRLAAIAPDAKVISADYDQHYNFLRKFVTSFEPNTDLIVKWARTMSDKRLEAVFNYLFNSDKRQAMADKLKVEWFEQYKVSSTYNSLRGTQQNELRRLFMSDASGADLSKLIRTIDNGKGDDENDTGEDIPVDDSTTLEQVFEFWKTSADIGPYTLTGVWWEALTTGINLVEGGTRERRLHDTLITKTDSSSLLWYRLLAIGTLISANRRTKQLLDFANQDAAFRGIWNATESTAYREAVDMVFQHIVSRDVPNEQASQENAIFWRRVFYDLRKIHHLIFENELHLTLLELLEDEIPFNQAAVFLRSGKLRNGQIWKGTLGESMNGPILFILRELHRIQIFKGRTSDPRPLFFSRHTSRALCSIGLTSTASAPGFDGAFELSRRLETEVHALCINDVATEAEAEAFLNAYDMPFLHFMLSLKSKK